MTMKSNAKFKEELTNFDSRTRKSKNEINE